MPEEAPVMTAIPGMVKDAILWGIDRSDEFGEADVGGSEGVVSES